ncbi:peptidoglycan DD-metalloendopeptidase family protein [Streptomyces sp. NPDC006879]|uniref:M23 family metallopeptidase n=1 Tax=Streptomyces sp. NPDC006879 TaxID=3364767 RepID=UPI0036B93DAB
MPAKGKHRRPKTGLARPVSRGIAVAGTGGAALALPLLGATGAQAAGQSAATGAHAVQLPAQSPAQQQVKATPAAAPKSAPTRTYTVAVGDYLSKIAQAEHVRGGWERLYADNREAVGDNPSLIHPGLKLTLHAKAGGSTESSRPSRAGSTAPAQQAAPSSGQADSAGRATRSNERAAAPKATTSKESTAANPAASTATAGGFTAPVSASITTPYHLAGGMWSSGYHTGVDFAVGTGTSVKAVGAGTVVSAGWAGAYGNEVVIRHEDGRYSQYAHLSSLAVSAGQTVSGGQQIGLSGSTGNSTGPHLHFEIRTGVGYGSDVDPLAYLRSKGVSI